LIWNENVFFDGGERYTVGGRFEKCEPAVVFSGFSGAFSPQSCERGACRRGVKQMKWLTFRQEESQLGNI
jgi:hypothetical protein